MSYDLNFVAIILATVANFGIGMAWYSPLLFANQWIKAMGHTPKEFEAKMKSANMTKTMGLSVLGALIQATVLAYFMSLMGTTGILAGAIVGFVAWLGFVMVTQLTHYAYETNNFSLFTIGAGYQLAALVAMGAIIGGL